MAQIIRLKRSTTSGEKPTTSSIVTGEIAINVYDGKAFTRKSGSVGSQLSNISVDQAATIKQNFTNQSTWVVTHNLNTINPIAQVYDANDYQIIPQTLRVTNSNTITVTFSQQESGYVVVAKGGHIVSGSVDANNISGLSSAILTGINATGAFSGSSQISLSGDVTGTAAATVISQIDGGSI